jgi:hypothetical protein
MPSAVRRIDLRTLRAAALTATGDVVALPFLTVGTLTWPAEHAHRVLHEWRLWLDGAGDVMRSSARVVRYPRQRAVVAVDVALAGEPTAAAGRLDALRRLEPAIDTVRVGPPTAVERARVRVPAGTTPVLARMRLRALPAAAVDALVAGAGPAAACELIAVELHHNRGAFTLAAIGAAAGAEQAERVRIGIDQLVRRVAPWT